MLPRAPYAVSLTATPDYFRAMDVPLVAGRYFSEAGMRAASPPSRF
jgi:hypothetical protein